MVDLKYIHNIWITIYMHIYSIGIVSSVRNMAKVMFYLYNMAIKFKSHRHRHRTHTHTHVD